MSPNSDRSGPTRGSRGSRSGHFVRHIHCDEQKLAGSCGQPMLELRCSRLPLQREQRLWRIGRRGCQGG